MALNGFLLECNEDPDCLCDDCHATCLQGRNYRLAELFNQTVLVLPRRRRAALDAVFHVTRSQIVLGKMYKEAALQEGRYRYFRCWAKNQPFYRRYLRDIGSDSEAKAVFNAHCQDVLDATYVFDNFDKITKNLMDRRITHLDARHFSIYQFRRSASIDWVIEQNANARERSTKKLTDPKFSAGEIQDISNYIISSGILERCGHDPTTAASLCQQVSHQLVPYCRKRKAAERQAAELSVQLARRRLRGPN